MRIDINRVHGDTEVKCNDVNALRLDDSCEVKIVISATSNVVLTAEQLTLLEKYIVRKIERRF